MKWVSWLFGKLSPKPRTLNPQEQKWRKEARERAQPGEVRPLGKLPKREDKPK